MSGRVAAGEPNQIRKRYNTRASTRAATAARMADGKQPSLLDTDVELSAMNLAYRNDNDTVLSSDGDFVDVNAELNDFASGAGDVVDVLDSTNHSNHLSDDGEEQPSSKVKPKFLKSEKSEFISLIYEDHNDAKSSKSDLVDDSDDEDINQAFNHDRKSSRPLISRQTSKRSAGYFELDEDENNEDESTLSIMIQVFIPFLIAGFGTVGAGLVLDRVQHWEVFQKVSEVFILVPALLGLKGNLEMTLASRLSTQANLGHFSTAHEQWRQAVGNVALIQCQATVVGFLAAMFAVIMDWLPEGNFDISHALLLCAASLLTASVASFVLGVVMIFVVIASFKCNINPDNVATPIAASLGDLTTLALLAYFSNLLFYTIDTSLWLCAIVILLFLALIPVWCLIAAQNQYTRDVLYTGWSPVIAAMAISSAGGCILDLAVSNFTGIAVFQPVINGVGGNLVAVQASRISTYLHKRSQLGVLPRSDAKQCFSPCSAFYGRHNSHAKTARVLLLMVVPGHLIFTYTISLVEGGHTSLTTMFLIVYLTAAVLQVFLLLYSAHIMILWMWRRKIDPDNSAIPYLTAIGDFLGTGLLAVAFYILWFIGDRDGDVGD